MGASLPVKPLVRYGNLVEPCEDAKRCGSALIVYMSVVFIRIF